MKKYISIFMAAVIIMTSTFASLSAGWSQYESGEWEYLNDDGTAKTNEWVISGGAWYYLGPDGLLLTNNYTPDGFWVNEWGIWEPKYGQRTDYASPIAGPVYSDTYEYRFYLDHYADGNEHWSVSEFYRGSGVELSYELYPIGPFSYEMMDILSGRTIGYIAVAPGGDVVYISQGGYTQRCVIGQ